MQSLITITCEMKKKGSGNWKCDKLQQVPRKTTTTTTFVAAGPKMESGGLISEVWRSSTDKSILSWQQLINYLQQYETTVTVTENHTTSIVNLHISTKLEDYYYRNQFHVATFPFQKRKLTNWIKQPRRKKEQSRKSETVKNMDTWRWPA